jgi:two-component system, response regulator
MREELHAYAPKYEPQPYLDLPRVDVLIIDSFDSSAEITALAIYGVVPEAMVVRFADRAAALRFIFGTGSQPAQTPRLILLDLATPVAQGLHVLQRLRSNPNTCGIPVVMLAATQDASAIDSSYLLGASGFIVKPRERERYRIEVERIVNRWLVNDRNAKNGA